MSDLDTLLQLRAWNHGAPLATATSLPWPRASAEQTVILAFVRMAGEATPWGFAIGAPGKKPVVHTIADPRDRDASAALAQELSEHLLPHVGHPAFGTQGEDAARAQLWVPGATHIDALHLLALRFVRARQGDRQRVTALRRLARGAGYLFREAQRPGQLRVMDASAKLRESFAFPAESLRQQHLGFLLAWLRPSAERGAEGRALRQERASIAEQQSISWTLDPALEEETLEPLVSAFNDARKQQAQTATWHAAIHEALEPELLRRWKLCEEAFHQLHTDPRPRNPMLGPLEELAREEHRWQYLRTEQQLLEVDESRDEASVFVIDPETDHSPAAAGHRYWSAVRSADLAAELVHGDRWLLAHALAEGAAIEGTVRAVRESKRGRATQIRWTLCCDSAIASKFRDGSDVALHGLPKRTATIVSITEDPRAPETRVIELEITGWKGARLDERIPAASDRVAYEGQRVAFVSTAIPELARRKAMQSWDDKGPGAWLTHARRKPVVNARAPRAAAASGHGHALLAWVKSQ